MKPFLISHLTPLTTIMKFKSFNKSLMPLFMRSHNRCTNFISVIAISGCSVTIANWKSKKIEFYAWIRSFFILIWIYFRLTVNPFSQPTFNLPSHFWLDQHSEKMLADCCSSSFAAWSKRIREELKKWYKDQSLCLFKPLWTFENENAYKCTSKSKALWFLHSNKTNVYGVTYKTYPVVLRLNCIWCNVCVISFSIDFVTFLLWFVTKWTIIEKGKQNRWDVFWEFVLY